MRWLLQCVMMVSPLASSLAPPVARAHTHAARLAFASPAARVRGARTYASTANTVAPTAKKPRVLSGIQPTGPLHIGNYFGAIRHWVLKQDHSANFFMAVDTHAIPVPH